MESEDFVRAYIFLGFLALLICMLIYINIRIHNCHPNEGKKKNLENEHSSEDEEFTPRHLLHKRSKKTQQAVKNDLKSLPNREKVVKDDLKFTKSETNEDSQPLLSGKTRSAEDKAG
ncbi:uncharacterized protein LOC130613143 [Hydractinia symbiolongicarpus]|uniref:uncharacterized protein LOC130613143 n=1 Tax=Hydractinia symbiolongicarpus TaxID=13093 RepID=UPI002550012F|nr:uncharacterized protein LOC130613143 [Hydractinia symbiolongicarpus]